MVNIVMLCCTVCSRIPYPTQYVLPTHFTWGGGEENYGQAKRGSTGKTKITFKKKYKNVKKKKKKKKKTHRGSCGM